MLKTWDEPFAEKKDILLDIEIENSLHRNWYPDPWATRWVLYHLTIELFDLLTGPEVYTNMFVYLYAHVPKWLIVNNFEENTV